MSEVERQGVPVVAVVAPGDPDGLMRPTAVTSRGPSRRSVGLARAVREMIGDRPEVILEVFLEIAYDERARHADRIAAARELLDRGYGKAPRHAPVEGGDPLEVSELDQAIRNIANQLLSRGAQVNGELPEPEQGTLEAPPS